MFVISHFKKIYSSLFLGLPHNSQLILSFISAYLSYLSLSDVSCDGVIAIIFIRE